MLLGTHLDGLFELDLPLPRHGHLCGEDVDLHLRSLGVGRHLGLQRGVLHLRGERGEGERVSVKRDRAAGGGER